MEAAFGVLADNPGSDEAVFAALALVSRSTDFEQVRPRLYEFWKAMDGKVFFKRLFMDKGALGLNFLVLFCFDDRCLLEISQQCGEEVIQTCMTLDGNDHQAIRDGIRCVAGLGSLSGTSMFLLQVLTTTTTDDGTRELALDAFARTTDPFLFEEDGQRAVELLSTEGFASVAMGIANRLEASVLSKPAQTLLFGLLHAKLRTKGNSAKDRRSLLVVCSAALLFLAPDRQALLPSKFLVGLAALSLVEIRVGLERIASGVVDEQADDGRWREQELPAVLASLEILDRVRCWLLLGEGAEDEDALLLRSLVSGMDSACLFLGQTRGSPVPEPLVVALRELVCGVLHLFWSDDPGSGVSSTLGGGNLPQALLVLCERGLREMLPVLARLDGDLVDSFLGPLYVRVEAELCALVGGGQWDLAVFAGLVMTGDQRDVALVEYNDNGASALQRLCLQGVWLVLSPGLPAASFLSESKRLLEATEEDEEESFWARKVQRVDLANLRRRVVLERGL